MRSLWLWELRGCPLVRSVNRGLGTQGSWTSEVWGQPRRPGPASASLYPPGVPRVPALSPRKVPLFIGAWYPDVALWDPGPHVQSEMAPSGITVTPPSAQLVTLWRCDLEGDLLSPSLWVPDCQVDMNWVRKERRVPATLGAHKTQPRPTGPRGDICLAKSGI